GRPVVELLVRLPGGPLAVVVVFGGHPQQLVLGLGGALLGGVQLGLQGLGLAVLFVEPAVLLFGLVFGVAGGLRGPGGVGPGAGRSGLFRRRLFAAGLGAGRPGGLSLGGLLGFFAHLRSSLSDHGLPRYGAACGASFRLPAIPSPSSSAKASSRGITLLKGIRVGPTRATDP